MAPSSRPKLALLLACLALAPVKAWAEDRWFSHDKALHLGLSLAMGSGATVVYTVARPEGHWAERGSVGFGASFLVGLGKEIYDEASGGSGFSWRDLTWDIVGSLVGAALVLALEAAFGALDRQVAAP